MSKKSDGQNFWKINIKIVISTQQFTPVWNFNHFVELQINGTKFAQKNMNDKNFGKVNINIVTSILEYTLVPNFS